MWGATGRFLGWWVGRKPPLPGRQSPGSLLLSSERALLEGPCGDTPSATYTAPSDCRSEHLLKHVRNSSLNWSNAILLLSGLRSKIVSFMYAKHDADTYSQQLF